MQKTDLRSFDNSWYKPGAGAMKRLLWYITNATVFYSGWLFPFAFKRTVLRLFGAKIGTGVVIKPRVNIKYAWNLEIGDYSWIGEHVWIDNLDRVSIGAHSCISQGALLLCGNHDYSKSSFDLIVKPISVGEGAWIGAKATVTQGVNIGAHSVLTVGSVASSDLAEYGIYRGNPAQKLKDRVIVS